MSGPFSLNICGVIPPLMLNAASENHALPKPHSNSNGTEFFVFT